MATRSFGPIAMTSFMSACLLVPGTSLAQGPAEPPDFSHLPQSKVPEYRKRLLHRLKEDVEVTNSASPFGGSTTLIRRHDWEVGAAAGPGLGWYGPWTPSGYYHSGWPYGPSVAPQWGYPGLVGGPFVGYPWGWPGYYSARAGQNWSNGLSLYGPPVPTYGPVPGVFGNDDLNKQWQAVPSLGLGYGWFGIYAASPRPRPLTVSVWPTVEPVLGAPQEVANVPPPAPGGGTMYISVKLPQPAAEVFVDGVKTSQTGTDRLFETPILEAGKKAQYELTVRWLEGGVAREVKKAVIGTPGEVVRVDFTSGN